MRIRLYHARICTMLPDSPIFRGEIYVNGDRIEKVLAYTDTIHPEAYLDDMPKMDLSFDQEIDCKWNLLMPGFKNAHTHSPMTFLRSMADDMPLEDWLHNQVFPMEAKLTPEAIYQFARLAILEYVSSGITSVFDMYLMPEVMANAAVDTGMRCVLTSGLNLFTSSIAQMQHEYEILNHKDPLISYQLGFHAEYTCDADLLREVSDLASDLKAPVFCHLAETAQEVANCKEKYGKTSVQFLCDLGIFDHGGAGYHLVHVSEDEMDLMQKYQIGVVSNPASNLKLASGIAPIRRYLERGISVALGTDGAASNNALDMFREMYLVSVLSKLREMDAASVDGVCALQMATTGGAQIMRLFDADALAEGKLADMILIDLQQPNMQPIHQIQKNIVYSGSKSNVKMTMIGGRILYQDGVYHIGDSPERIYELCEKEVRKLMR